MSVRIIFYDFRKRTDLYHCMGFFFCGGTIDVLDVVRLGPPPCFCLFSGQFAIIETCLSVRQLPRQR